MVLLIKYKKDWRATIDDQISAFVDENAILQHEWEAKLYDAQQRLVTGADLGLDNFPLRLEYTRISNATVAPSSSASCTDEQVLPLRPRSTSWLSIWIYTLVKWIFLAIALLFYFGFFFAGEEGFDPDDPEPHLRAMWPRFSWLLPPGYVNQTRHHFETGFANVCFLRQQAAMLVVILLLMRHKTFPALISIANIGGFGLCVHAYHLDSSTEERWPMLIASVLGVYVIMFNPDSRLTSNRKLIYIIFMYVLGFASCYLILGAEPLPRTAAYRKLYSATTTTTSTLDIYKAEREEF